jgi:hypothetical protein
MLASILDKNLPNWLSELKITELPPPSESTITLFNRITEAWQCVEQNTEIKLCHDEFAFFECILRKMCLCLPAYGDRIYRVEFYDRSSVVYCGFCDGYPSARNPMSLKQANDHIGYFHANQEWKTGMLRQSPVEQPIYDAHCTNCNLSVLVAARQGEAKSGLECKHCHRKWCFQCMDKRVWFGTDHKRTRVIPTGEGPFQRYVLIE